MALVKFKQGEQSIWVNPELVAGVSDGWMRIEHVETGKEIGFWVKEKETKSEVIEYVKIEITGGDPVWLRDIALVDVVDRLSGKDGHDAG